METDQKGGFMIRLRIAIAGAQNELLIEQDISAEEAMATIDGSLGKSGTLIWITDRKGRRTGVNAERIAYVEVEEDDARTVGFSVS